MSAHTPGPWTFGICLEAGRFGGGFEVRSATAAGATKQWPLVICHRAPFPDRVAEMEANARLIAAAPELLDVVKRGRQKLATYVSVYQGDKELRSLLDAWDAAIAKTEGR